MYIINDAYDVLREGGVLAFIPFSTMRKTAVPEIPDEIHNIIPGARETFEKIKETSNPRNTFYYQSGGNQYLFHRVKSSSKAHAVSIDLLNAGLDILESELDSVSAVLILGTGDDEMDKYIKLMFKNNSSVFFMERQNPL